MTVGRTTWWPKDAAWHRRELIVELGEEFGAEGPHLVDVLCAWAQEQKATGEVKGGFRALSREAFIAPDACRTILEFASSIGAVDELDVAEDGRRFTCRISGWRADQERGRAAWRKAAQRDRERLPIFERDGYACVHCGSGDDLTVDHVIATVNGGSDDDSNKQTLCGTCNRKKGAKHDAEVTARHGASRSVTPSPVSGPAPEEGLKAVRFGGRIVPAKVVTIAEATLADFNERAGTAYKPYTGGGKPTEAFKRIIGAFVERDITLDQAVRINALGLQGRFWEGPAQPGHVWSPGVIERNIEATRGTVASNGGSGERERFLEAQKRALGDPENVA